MQMKTSRPTTTRRHLSLMASHRAAAFGLLLFCILPSFFALAQWKTAKPGKNYQFPADHHTHPDFQTEWWYFTGNLRASEDGHELGYQITWFRQGIRPPGDRAEVQSRFVIDHLHFVHLAVSDVRRKAHHFEQIAHRGAYGEAGTGAAPAGQQPLVWVDPCRLTLKEDGSFHIVAKNSDGTLALDLRLRPTRAPVFNGVGGLSQKAPGEGNGSHYYSLTRMETTGEVRVDGRSYSQVTGLSWFDREWSTSALGDGQAGWDWFALNLSDGADLMLYQLRRDDGTRSPFSSGTLRKPDGTIIHLPSEAYQLQPGRTWKSQDTGGHYPVEWKITLPEHALDVTVSAAFDAQEMALFPVTYWEGAVRVEGSHSGEGYMELTGYAGEVPLH